MFVALLKEKKNASTKSKQTVEKLDIVYAYSKGKIVDAAFNGT